MVPPAGEWFVLIGFVFVSDGSYSPWGSWHKAQSPCNFLNDEVIEASFVIHCKLFWFIPEFMVMRWLVAGSPWIASEWGLVARVNNPVIRELELSVPPLTPPLGKKVGLGIELITNGSWFNNCTYIMSLHKNYKCRGLESFWLVNPREAHPKLYGDKCSRPSRIYSMYLFIQLFICILYNTLDTVSDSFPWVLGAMIGNYCT